MSFDDLIQCANLTYRLQRRVSFNAQALMIEVIQHIESLKHVTSDLLVMHEIR